MWPLKAASIKSVQPCCRGGGGKRGGLGRGESTHDGTAERPTCFMAGGGGGGGGEEARPTLTPYVAG